MNHTTINMPDKAPEGAIFVCPACGKSLAVNRDPLQPTPGLNSMVVKAISVLADDIRHIDEIEEVISFDDPDKLSLFNSIKSEGIQRPKKMIAELIKREAEIALQNRKDIVTALK